MTPDKIWDPRITTNPSFGDISFGKCFGGGINVLFFASTLITTLDFLFGRMSMENTCFPVHNMTGLKTVGGGMSNCMSASDIIHKSCTNEARSKNESLWEIKYEPVMKSCVAAMMGSPDFGVSKLFFTPIKLIASARASSVWGTCKFISSPSKSAL